jgi:hypothetical protein
MKRVIIAAVAFEVGAGTWLLAKAPTALLPDPALTPGAVVNVDQATLCQVGYAASVRHYDRRLRDRVFNSYGLVDVDRRDYEIDHLVPVSIAGAPDDARNLWPESRRTEPYNAEVKDTLEDVLHREVCAGRVSLKEAQDAIRTDWIAAYQKYVGSEPRRFVARSQESE